MKAKQFETIQIKRGRLGPLQETNKVEIRPLTVLIGGQGTGKSLLSQVLYFFRDLPYLVRYYDAFAQARDRDVSEKGLVRWILDELRSRDRALAVFADPSASIYYQSATRDQRTLSFRMESRNRQVFGHKALLETVGNIRVGDPVYPPGRALFVPAERMLYSHARGPSVWDLLPVPSTLRLFADAIESAGDIFSQRWQNGMPDTAEGAWTHQHIWSELGGEVVRAGDRWKWKFPGEYEEKLIDIDMASSGQKANWPLVLLGEVLFSWLHDGQIQLPFFLHVEEPEIHLHPNAQVAMVKVLAYLVNRGFYITITTHSLTVMYALNNLILAREKLADTEGLERVPEVEVRLDPEKVAAYLLHEGRLENIKLDSGEIDESRLGNVLGDLEAEYNRLAAYGTLWE